MPIFNSHSTSLIRNWDQTTENQVKIKRLTTHHAEENQFINFTDQVSSMTSKLVIESEKGEKKLPGVL